MNPKNRQEATSEQIDACFREAYDYFRLPTDERQDTTAPAPTAGGWASPDPSTFTGSRSPCGHRVDAWDKPGSSPRTLKCSQGQMFSPAIVSTVSSLRR
jgi:hypothetical protein